MQKAAFNCLCAYKIKPILAYEVTIRKLLDENQIRSEIASFSINNEGHSRILDSHRGELIPIIQRIVFGRMVSKVGKKTSGIKKASKRKDFVMRFIGGCSESEIRDFFRLTFGSLAEYSTVSYKDLKDCLSRDVDVTRFIPLGRFKAMLETIESFLKEVGHTKPGLLSDCFKLINVIGHRVSFVLDSQESAPTVTKHNLALLKELRRSCMCLLTSFYHAFEYYPYSLEEVDFSFDHLVWPACRGFIDRNHATVTPILKLIAVFCATPTYHNLLIKRNRSDSSEYLLNLLIDFTCHGKPAPNHIHHEFDVAQLQCRFNGFYWNHSTFPLQFLILFRVFTLIDFLMIEK